MSEKDYSKYSSEYFNSVLTALIFTYTSNSLICPVSTPYACLMGGQSGSGKSNIHQLLKERFQNNIIIIDGDTLRTFHPNNKKLDEIYRENSVIYKSDFAGKMVESLTLELSKLHYNIAVEGTLRTKEVPLHTCDIFKTNGYKNIELYIMGVKPEISFSSTIVRFLTMKNKISNKNLSPRITPQYHHDAIINSICNNLDYLYSENVFSNIKILNRNKSILYDMNLTPCINPKNILENILFGEWNGDEINSLNNNIQFIINEDKKNIFQDYIDELITFENNLNTIKDRKHR